MLRHFFVTSIILVFGLSSSAPAAPKTPTDEDWREAQTAFTLRGQPIHPKLLRLFEPGVEETRPVITAVDLLAALDSGDYPQSEIVRVSHDTLACVDTSKTPTEYRAYRWLGRLPSNLHVLLTASKDEGGTFAPENVVFLAIERSQAYDDEDGKPYTRMQMSVKRSYPIGDRAQVIDARIEGDHVALRFRVFPSREEKTVILRMPAS